LAAVRRERRGVAVVAAGAASTRVDIKPPCWESLLGA
jgi:hypothetical protein